MTNHNKLGQIPPDVLRSFMLVADTGSFTQAAKLVFRTQAAISLQIKRLEAELGDKLFIRDGRSTTLTEKGKTLYIYASKIIDLYDEAFAAIAQPELSGHVRLGVPDDYATKHLPNALKRFSVAYPMVQVDVICDDTHNLIDELNGGSLDLVITTDGHKSLHSIQLDLVWIMAELMDPRDYEVLPLALFHSECCYCTNALTALGKVGWEHRTAYRSPSLTGVMAAVQSGIGVAPVTKDTWMEGCRHASPVDGLPKIEPVYLTLRLPPGSLSSVVSAFASFIGNEMGLSL